MANKAHLRLLPMKKNTEPMDDNDLINHDTKERNFPKVPGFLCQSTYVITNTMTIIIILILEHIFPMMTL